jgi:hypothetical protein
VLRCFARCDNHTIHVIYNTPVNLDGNYNVDANNIVVNGLSYGANQAEVILDVEPLGLEALHSVEISDVTALGGSQLEPNPSTCTFYYGFNRFCADFNDGQLPPGSVSSGTTPPYVGPEFALHLTDQANSQANYWTVPLPAVQNFQVFRAQWKMLIQGVGGADGVSFNAG